MAVNLAPNSTFLSNTAGWGTTQGTITHQPGAGQDGDGFLRFASSITGNANLQQSPPIPCVPGDVFSAEGYFRQAVGSQKPGVIMVQFLNDSLVQTGNIMAGGIVGATAEWQRRFVLNATAPAGTTQARIQLRITSSVPGDTHDWDNIYLNSGPTVDRSQAPAGTTYTILRDGVEVPVVAFEVVNGGVAAPLTMP